MSKELVDALDALEAERGIERTIVIEALEDALRAAYKKQYNAEQNVEAIFDTKKGNVAIKQVKVVVLDEDFENEDTEMMELIKNLSVDEMLEIDDYIIRNKMLNK